MKIINKTRNTVIAEDAVEVKSVKDKTLGLLSYEKPRALVLRTRFGIHTLGMKFTIDLIVLDSNNRVVKMRSNLKPNGLFFWNPKHSVVFELPEQTIVRSKTQLEDVVKYIL